MNDNGESGQSHTAEMDTVVQASATDLAYVIEELITSDSVEVTADNCEMHLITYVIRRAGTQTIRGDFM